MGLLALQRRLGHEHGEVAVLDPELLNLSVEELLDLFPYGEAPWTEDIAPRDVVVLDHLGFGDDLGEPVGVVLAFGGGDPEQGAFFRVVLGLGFFDLGFFFLSSGRGTAFIVLPSKFFVLDLEGLEEFNGEFFLVLKSGIQ